MAAREALHRLVDTLPEPDLPTAVRVLEALSLSADSARRSLDTSSPFGAGRRTARVLSPRLAHAAQASDFKKAVLESPPDAGI